MYNCGQSLCKDNIKKEPLFFEVENVTFSGKQMLLIAEGLLAADWEL